MVVKLRKKKKGSTAQTEDVDLEESCIHCHEDLRSDDVDALACEICDLWSCRTCINVPTAVYTYLQDHTETFPFICKVCSPKLPEMKEMIELKHNYADLQKKVLSVETKQQEDETRLTSIELQIAELTKANQSQTGEIKELNETITEMKAKALEAGGFPDLTSANPPQQFIEMISKRVQPTLKPMINTQINERDQIELIKHNLVISGMTENTNDEDDAVKFAQMIKDEMDLVVEVESTARLQRKEQSADPKLLKVVLKDMKIRKAILSKATTLRNSAAEHVKTKVYIRPELTSKQLEESKNLSTELRAKKAANAGRRYKIYRGRIIEIPPIIPNPDQE